MSRLGSVKADFSKGVTHDPHPPPVLGLFVSVTTDRSGVGAEPSRGTKDPSLMKGLVSTEID